MHDARRRSHNRILHFRVPESKAKKVEFIV